VLHTTDHHSEPDSPRDVLVVGLTEEDQRVFILEGEGWGGGIL